jgi:RNA processing factor Prp31
MNKKMNEDIQKLHIQAGLVIGKDKTCGKKINYTNEDKAAQYAEKMNSKASTRNTLEGYPCVFCRGWHVGKEMSRSELESYLDKD